MKFLTLEEVAAQLHWAPGTARNRISRGAPMPPHIKIGHRLLFPAPEFERWVSSRVMHIKEPNTSGLDQPKGRRGRPRNNDSGSLA